MRNILLVLVGASACAARSQVPTIPVANQFTCGDMSFERVGSTLQLGNGTSKFGWADSEGDHYVNWPVSQTDVSTVEFTIPRDGHSDAIQHVWDTSRGTSRTEWRLLASEVCQSKGSYSYVLARWMNGASLDDLSRELAVDHTAARELVHDALLTAQKRYFRDR
jgi:hypothetical protein